MPEVEEDNQISALIEPGVSQGASADPVVLEEMAKAGVLYGRKKTKTHSRMRPYIFTTRNGIEIFDLTKTIAALEKAQEFLGKTVKGNGIILLVGTQPASKDLIKQLGEKFGFPHVTERWLGGTLTNFKTISQRLKYYMDLKADRESGKLEKYTKKEQWDFDKEIRRLTFLFGGLERLTRPPDMLLVVDVNDHETAVREAKRLNIPVVALISSDTDPEAVSYPIPGNSRAHSSIQWVLGKLEQTIEEARSQPPPANS